MKNKILFSCAVLYGIFLISGCKKDNQGPAVKADFTVSSNSVHTGDTVNFTNKSQHANFYQWDFADGNTSIAESPTHIYTTSGGYTVLLRAIGSSGSDTATQYITVLKKTGTLISEGIGIDEISLGDTWATVKQGFSISDTAYYSNYLAQYDKYSNMVYFQQEGIVAGFISTTSTVQDNDLVYVVIVVSPYPGQTTKGIAIGSTLTEVINKYGYPETSTDTTTYTIYSYATKGVDFAAYKGNGHDGTTVSEIDVYNPITSGRLPANDERIALLPWERDKINLLFRKN